MGCGSGEGYLGREVTDKDWSRILQWVPKVSRNARFKQIQLNCVHQAYLTPHHLSKMFASAQNVCPRCGATSADILLMIWACGKLVEHWDGVREVIGRVQTDRFSRPHGSAY